MIFLLLGNERPKNANTVHQLWYRFAANPYESWNQPFSCEARCSGSEHSRPMDGWLYSHSAGQRDEH